MGNVIPNMKQPTKVFFIAHLVASTVAWDYRISAPTKVCRGGDVPRPQETERKSAVFCLTKQKAVGWIWLKGKTFEKLNLRMFSWQSLHLSILLYNWWSFCCPSLHPLQIYHIFHHDFNFGFWFFSWAPKLVLRKKKSNRFRNPKVLI